MGRGSGSPYPPPKSAPAANLPIWSWHDGSIRTIHVLDGRITICKPLVIMCTGGKRQQKAGANRTKGASSTAGGIAQKGHFAMFFFFSFCVCKKTDYLAAPLQNIHTPSLETL